MTSKSEMAYGRQNLDYVETLYNSFLGDPYSVDEQWRDYFQNMDGYEPSSRFEVLPPDEEPTGTYDTHLTADEHPIIHRAGDSATQATEVDVGDIPKHIFDFIGVFFVFFECHL